MRLIAVTQVCEGGARDTERTGAGPVVKWAGGKRALRGPLLALAPAAFGTYYEPFLGGAALFLALSPARAVLSDANCDLIAMYEAVRDAPARVVELLETMQPHVLDEAYYYEVRAKDPARLTAEERAARFIFLNKTCYNGLYRVNRRGQFNVPFGRYATPPALFSRANVEQVARRLRRATLRCGDFEEALADAGAGDFVYLDPPYMPLTPTANFTKYTRGAFGSAEQRRLAEVVHQLTARGCRVLLSNSDTPVIRELYARYAIDVVYAPRNINSDTQGRGRIAELAIRNYGPTSTPPAGASVDAGTIARAD